MNAKEADKRNMEMLGIRQAEDGTFVDDTISAPPRNWSDGLPKIVTPSAYFKKVVRYLNGESYE